MNKSLDKGGYAKNKTKNKTKNKYKKSPGPRMARRRNSSRMTNFDGELIDAANSAPGLCGLHNLGNTCFMNSVIQCLNNCPPLAKYFLDDEYVKNLNTENPIGMKGKIASTFGELIKRMWSGRCAFTVPIDFLKQAAAFSPQFPLRQQQDAQELLTFLLDGLHEDLNKIKCKEYIQMNDSNVRPDEVMAAEAWKMHTNRNDSIIVEYFHGLLKSTLVCPDCAKVSVTFDPFCNLSIPLPTISGRCIEVIFLPSDVMKKPYRVKLMVPKKGCINDLLCALSYQCGVSPNDLIVADISDHYFNKFYSNNESVASIGARKDTVIYEVPRIHDSRKKYVTVPVVLWEKTTGEIFNRKQLFGFPMLIVLPKELEFLDMSHDNFRTYHMIYQAILFNVSRFMDLPNIGCFHSDIDSAACSTSCNCRTPEVVENIFPHEIFTIFINSSFGIFPLYDCDFVFEIPFSDLGSEILVAQWTRDNMKVFSKSFLGNELVGRESVRQKRSQNIQLHDCLKLFTTCEKLGANDGWYCPDCKKHQPATKKFDLWTLPKILILHLKRVQKNGNRCAKINSLVEYHEKDLDMSSYVSNGNHPPAKYNLFGVCNHYGSMNSGHYNAYAFNRIYDQWFKFDDRRVSTMPQDTVVSNAAHVLFYIRSDL